MDKQHTSAGRKQSGIAGRRAGLPGRVARDLLTVRRAFGEPIERNGVTLVPVARVAGGSGYGHGEGDVPAQGRGEHTPGAGSGSGGGGGFGVGVSPIGVFVIRGDDVSWQPAFDLNRAILGGQIVALFAVITVATALRRARR